MTSTILFLCPHGAAKSVLAAAYFNHLAEEAILSFVADSAGTEPDPAISPAVIELLRGEGIDVPQGRPRQVSHDDLMQAQRVISLGCQVEALAADPDRLEQWLDVPSPGSDLIGASKAIRAHVVSLIAQLDSNVTVE
jgi:arsenate reductase (thioredoxin)